MAKRATRSINSSWLLAAAISICPAVAGAQTWNPTASDAKFNTAAGGLALPNHASSTGDLNSAFGYQALRFNTTGHYNTATGVNALYSNTTGTYNTANGVAALFNNAEGIRNTATGAYALYNNTGGFENAALGAWALYANTTGSSNTATGFNALYYNTSGSHNTATGFRSLSGNLVGNHDVTGSYNTADGTDALSLNTVGDYNTAVGAGALKSNSWGEDNTASGAYALYKNDTGAENTANGVNALYANTTGNNNTALGHTALGSNTFGANNVAVGNSALTALKGGSNNVAVGTGAGKWTKTGSSNIYIGHFGNGGGTESKVIRIGQAQTRTFIAGIKGVPLSGATVVVKANGQLGVVASSARYKMDIRDLSDASDRLAQLRPVSYQYKTEPGVTHFGLIAEEVDRVMPELVVRDEQNRPETVQYHELIPLLLQQVKQQGELIEQQTRTASRDHATIERLEARLDRQATELSELRRTRFAATAAAK